MYKIYNRRFCHIIAGIHQISVSLQRNKAFLLAFGGDV